jgi:hypothetical protein
MPMENLPRVSPLRPALRGFDGSCFDKPNPDYSQDNVQGASLFGRANGAVP